MEGFELLIIAIFILLSILEGVLGKKKRESRKKKDAPEAPEDEGAEPWWAGSGGPEGEGPSSSDVLVPEEIWEEITGEERRESRREPAAADVAAGDEEVREEGGEGEEDDRTPAERLESLRYEGSGERRPEAKLEPADASGEAISLEKLEIDSEARHRRFHRRYLPSVRAGGTAYGTSRGAGASRLRKELDLRGPRALRRAVVYREILGPPKAIREDEIGGR